MLPSLGGTTTQGGASSFGGATSRGGAPAATGGTTAASSGGTTNTAMGGSAFGGSGVGGTVTATGGTTAAGGSTGSTTGGSGSGTATPSPGCSKGTGRPANGSVAVNGDHYFAFPAGYDGTKPFPVLFGFHGCGSGNRGTNKDDTQWMSLTKGTGFETAYVRAVPVSTDSAGCWSINTDITRVTKAFDDLLANYCVDTSRIFATGHSSGAQFVVQVLTRKNDAQHFNFKAVAPVSASDYGALSGPIPVMYIQGKMDKERNNGDGKEVVARLRAANSCMDTSKPYADVMGCQSSGTTVNPGCISYDGCSKPTIWCSHNDPFYQNTMHGVPCFGVKAMLDFFTAQP